MFKFLSISRKQSGVIITLFVLIFFGASYFFIYVPNNEKTVQERRFRCLQNIDNNIHFKIDNSFLLVNNLLDVYAKKSNDGLNNYINEYNKSINKYYSKADFRVLESVAPGIYNDSLTLYVGKVKDKITEKSPEIYVRFEVEQFIKPLLPADVFDNYIIFCNKNKLFETFRSGFDARPDSLVQVKSGVISPGIRSVKIGGTDYKIFAQPVNTDNSNNWLVAGLVSVKNYDKEKNQLPLSIILLLLTAAIGIIVSIPWIKLYHMGNKDKLTARDGIATILIAMVLMSLLFFVFYKYNQVYLIKAPKSFNSKDSLANKVTNAFERELETTYAFLDTCDKAYKNDKTDILNLGRGSKYDYLLKTDQNQKIRIHQVFWLDTLGREKNNWVTDVSIPKGTDLSMRDYFISAKNNKPNSVRERCTITKDKHTKAEQYTFFLSQNISRATGVFTSVIAKKSILDTTVAAIGFTVKSLDNVIMPDGYQFAIIDESGKVLYHYHPALNLNENLKTEFADSSKLISCLEARSDTTFDAEYHGKRYNVKIKPFADLPYSTVIFEDLEYNDTRDMEAYAFTLSMLLCLLVFLIIQFTVVFLASSKKSLFKKQLFETSWVGPKISSHRQYNEAIVANVIIIGLMILFLENTFSKDSDIIKSSFIEYIYIILFSIILTSLFLNLIFARKYRLEKNFKYRYKKKAIICLLFFILIIDIAAFRTLSTHHLLYLLGYEIISATVCGALLYWMPDLFSKMQRYKVKIPFKWAYTQSFAMMATTRLVITSGIPVAFFFIYSYDYEQNLDTRYKQYHFAKDLTQKIRTDNITSKKLDSIHKGLMYTSGIYYDGVYVQNVELCDLPHKKNKDKPKYNDEDYLTAKILSAFRFRINNVETKNNNMNLASVDSVAFFNKLTREKGEDTLVKTYYRIKPDKYILLSSLNTNYKGPRWIMLLLGVFLFYIVIHHIIRKLFALDLPSADGWAEMDENLLKNNDLNKLLILLGSPGSGKLSKLKDALKQYDMHGHDGKRLVYDEHHPLKGNVFVADMILIPDGDEEDLNKDHSAWKQCTDTALKDQYSLVIINHLEYNIKDAQTNNMKLELLEALMHKGKSKIIIISTVHPVSFLDSHNQQIKKVNKQATESPQTSPQPENELERWQVLFGHFRIIIEPLEDSEVDEKASPMDQIIKKELQYSHFLNKMKGIIPVHPEPENNDLDMQSDSLIFKLQLMSQYFYTYIWQSLTMEEKFLLYDLAEDGLVNSYDDYNLSLLISKRLIVRSDGTLMLFNKGFRNFILTAIGETEANRIKEQVKANGNWDSLKTPMSLVILAILAFLFASQEEAYSRIITYITAFSAGIPAVLKVFSLFGGSTPKAE